MSFLERVLASADRRQKIFDEYDSHIRENEDLYKIIRLIPDFPWNSPVVEYFGEFGKNGTVSLILGTSGNLDYIGIKTGASIEVKDYVCTFLEKFGFSAEIADVNFLKITRSDHEANSDTKRKAIELFDLKVRKNAVLHNIIGRSLRWIDFHIPTFAGFLDCLQQ